MSTVKQYKAKVTVVFETEMWTEADSADDAAGLIEEMAECAFPGDLQTSEGCTWRMLRAEIAEEPKVR